jgi:hypothetical protein
VCRQARQVGVLLFYHLSPPLLALGALLGEGSSKTPHTPTHTHTIQKKSDPRPFLASDPPPHQGTPVASAMGGGLEAKGSAKKKSGTPVVGGWVRVRKRTRVRFIFLIFF